MNPSEILIINGIVDPYGEPIKITLERARAILASEEEQQALATQFNVSEVEIEAIKTHAQFFVNQG